MVNYSSVINLTSTDPLTNNGDAVSFHAEEGNFYYQGNMVSTDLPWRFELSYYLDGVKTAPAGPCGQIREDRNPYSHQTKRKNKFGFL